MLGEILEWSTNGQNPWLVVGVWFGKREEGVGVDQIHAGARKKMNGAQFWLHVTFSLAGL